MKTLCPQLVPQFQDVKMSEKMTKFKLLKKSDKNSSEGYIPTMCISSKHGHNVCKVSKVSVLTVGGVAHTRYPLSIYKKKKPEKND